MVHRGRDVNNYDDELRTSAAVTSYGRRWRRRLTHDWPPGPRPRLVGDVLVVVCARVRDPVRVRVCACLRVSMCARVCACSRACVGVRGVSAAL